MELALSFIVGSVVLMKVSEIRLNNSFQDRKRVGPSKYITVKGWIKILRNGVEVVR